MSVATYPGLLTHSLTLLPFNSPDPAPSPPQAFLQPRLMFSSVHPPSHLSGLTPTSLGKPLATLTRPQPLLHFLLALLYFPAQHLSDYVWDTWFDGVWPFRKFCLPTHCLAVLSIVPGI